MYKIIEVSDRIRVPPEKFDLDLEEAVKASLEARWDCVTDKNLGVVLSVNSVNKIGEGIILPGDGAIYYPVDFTVLSYKPEQHEIVKGEVIDVVEFGVFVRIGPVDGMIHVSQLMDDFVSYDAKNSMFIGKKTKRKIKEGDIVIARIISISFIGNQYKIGLTIRQPGLGVLDWFKEEKKEKKPKKETKAGKSK
jgi:DNA-directed RNA polymerase subunit E'